MLHNMDLGDIHLNRAEFTHDVSEMISDHAQRLGLTLVSASLVGVDQSDLSQRDENNTFNALTFNGNRI